MTQKVRLEKSKLPKLARALQKNVLARFPSSFNSQSAQCQQSTNAVQRRCASVPNSASGNLRQASQPFLAFVEPLWVGVRRTGNHGRKFTAKFVPCSHDCSYFTRRQAVV
jgi:hypothetical protein